MASLDFYDRTQFDGFFLRCFGVEIEDLDDATLVRLFSLLAFHLEDLEEELIARGKVRYSGGQPIFPIDVPEGVTFGRMLISSEGDPPSGAIN